MHLHHHHHHHPSLLSLLLTTTLLLSTPCAATVTWLYPQSTSNALSYNYNDLVYFTWESNFTNPSLTLWCASGGAYYNLSTTPLVPPNGTSAQSFPYAPSFNETCHMSLYCHDSSSSPSSPSSSSSPSSPSSSSSSSKSGKSSGTGTATGKCGSDYVGQSAEFGLAHDDQAVKAQTWGADVAKSASASASSTGTGTSTSVAPGSVTGTGTAGSGVGVTGAAAKTSAVATQTPAPTSSSASGNSASLTPAAKAGLGVGVGVGGILLIIAAFWFVIRARRRRSEGFGSGGGGAMKGPNGQFYTSNMQEMDGEGRRGELSGTAQQQRAELGVGEGR